MLVATILPLLFTFERGRRRHPLARLRPLMLAACGVSLFVTVSSCLPMLMVTGAGIGILFRSMPEIDQPTVMQSLIELGPLFVRWRPYFDITFWLEITLMWLTAAFSGVPIYHALCAGAASRGERDRDVTGLRRVLV